MYVHIHTHVYIYTYIHTYIYIYIIYGVIILIILIITQIIVEETCFYTSYQCTKKGERSLKNDDIKINLGIYMYMRYFFLRYDTYTGKREDNTRIQTNKPQTRTRLPSYARDTIVA